MPNKIIIIHKKDIIRKGVESIIKETLQYPVAVFSDFDTKAIQPKPGDNILFISDKINARKIQASPMLFNLNAKLIVFNEQPEIQEDGNSSHQISLNSSQETLCKQIEHSFSGPHQIKSAAHKNELSRREREILGLVAMGFSNKEMAEKLFISPHTVISHRKNITEKLGIKTISGLTVYAVINGIIDLGQISRDDLI